MTPTTVMTSMTRIVVHTRNRNAHDACGKGGPSVQTPRLLHRVLSSSSVLFNYQFSSKVVPATS